MTAQETIERLKLRAAEQDAQIKALQAQVAQQAAALAAAGTDSSALAASLAALKAQHDALIARNTRRERAEAIMQGVLANPAVTLTTDAAAIVNRVKAIMQAVEAQVP